MEIFGVLSDPSRRKIVELLAAGERHVGELTERLELSQPGVSRHLRILRDAGLVRSRTQGQRRVYCLKPTALDPVDDWLERRRRDWQRRLDDLEEYIRRPRPKGEAR